MSVILQQPQESIPESVRYLDVLFDELVRSSETNNELLEFWLRIACDVKRRVASVPPSAVDATARAELARLRRDLSARSV